MRHSETAKIVIVGAGPVGMALALSLAHHDVPSVLLEKKAQLDPYSKAIALFPRSLEIFETLGLLEELKSKGQVNNHIIVRKADTRDTIIDMDFNSLDQVTTANFAIAIPQNYTEDVLVKAVQAHPHIDLRFGAEFASFDDKGDHVQVSYQAEGETHSIMTDYLIGTDGARSAVRQQFGWELKGKTYDTRAFLADIEVTDDVDNTDGWLADNNADSFITMVRFKPNTWRIIDQSVPESVGEDDLHEHGLKLGESVFGTGAVSNVLWTSAYRKHERQSDKFFEGRVILAGDAAHLNSPAGGQGLNTGLRDTHNLSWKLAMIVNHGGDPTQMLNSYEQEQRTAFLEEVAPLTDMVEKAQTAPFWLRKIVLRNLWVGRFFGQSDGIAHKLSMLFTDYGASPILDDGKGELIGTRMPNVQTPEGRLHRLVGPKGLLLTRHEPTDRKQGLCPNITIVRLPDSLNERGFDNASEVFVRPDEIIARIAKGEDQIAEASINQALGLRGATEAEQRVSPKTLSNI